MASVQFITFDGGREQPWLYIDRGLDELGRKYVEFATPSSPAKLVLAGAVPSPGTASLFRRHRIAPARGCRGPSPSRALGGGRRP
jgi:hypothetical protein